MTEAKQPWKMWGNSQTLTLTGGIGSGRHQNQLAQVDYHRPESWHFFFAARLVDSTALAGALVNINFDLHFGVGRSQLQLDPFARFNINWVAAPPIGAVVFANTVPGIRNVPAVVGDVTNMIEQIPAQQINCICNTAITAGAGEIAIVEVHAYFAPITHVRPDWFHRDFSGGELEGL